METKAEIIERALGKADADGAMAGQLAFKKIDILTKLDNEVIKEDQIVLDALKESGALTVMTQVDKQGNLKTLGMAGKLKDKTSQQLLGFFAYQIMDFLETVTSPLPGQEVSFEQPWKAQRKLQLGFQSAGQEALLDVTYRLHGVRGRGSNTEAVVFLKGEIRGQKGNDSGVSGQMTGQAVVDLKANQIRFADANLNIDLDLGSGRNTTQANGTMKIVMERIELKGEEREKALKSQVQTSQAPNTGDDQGAALIEAIKVLDDRIRRNPNDADAYVLRGA